MSENLLKQIIVTGPFDDLRSRGIRFLEEASKLGELTALAWSDAAITRLTGTAPKFPEAERRYFLSALRYVSQVKLASEPVAPDALPLGEAGKSIVWAMPASENNAARQAWCAANGVECRTFSAAQLAGFPDPFAGQIAPAKRRKVIVTGCYDWFHSGHVRFFEEVSAFGELYVALGNDANVEQLKGKGHPLFPQDERRYVVQSIRYVAHAVVSTGYGWLDAEPEIRRIRPDIYAVNEDGDKPEKREFCQAHGLEYVVLKRLPKEGLPRRESTQLRGF
jgi:cytidyltransferase-like protein